MSRNIYVDRQAGPAPPVNTGKARTPFHTIATGIPMGAHPLQFNCAIDTAQTKISNQMLMAYVGELYRQHFHQVVQDGFCDSPQCYPYMERIQQAFGEQHDISGLKAHTGIAAQAANARLGSQAFHKGGHVAFAGRPTLEEAAHEAAHGVQQAAPGSSVRLKDSIGEDGDKYERHADAVAQAVIRGESAEPLLDQVVGNPTEVAATAATGHAPVQMMWPNLTGRVLSAMIRANVRRPGGAPQIRSGVGQNLLFNPRRHVWNKDILFGVDHGDTQDLAIKQEAATDSVIARHRFGYLNKPVPPGFSTDHLWGERAFNFADRKQLNRRDRPYMDYAREAIATAMARGGNIYWALGQLHFDKVFSDLFRVQEEYGIDPVRYMAEVSFPEIMDKHGKFIDTSSGEEVKEPVVHLNMPMESDLIAWEKFKGRLTKGEIQNITPFQPLITTIEIIGFLMGDERKYLDRTTFFDASHQEADLENILSAYHSVLDQLLTRQGELSPENDYKLEQPIYRPLNRYSGYPCGRCDEVFRVDRELIEHWERFPQHRP